MPRCLLLCFCCLLLSAWSSAQAELKLPAVFTDHGVLQRGMPLRIWGWAAPGSEVAVELSQLKPWNDAQPAMPESVRATATTDQTGRFTVMLPAIEAAGSGTLIVTSEQKTETRNNILIGEVWFCSGQSNMQWSVNQSSNPQATIQAADHPAIRLLPSPRVTSETAMQDIDSHWAACTPATVAGFSAVAYNFGLTLHQELGVPVGLIHASWGGTPAEAWTSWASLEHSATTTPIIQRALKERDPSRPLNKPQNQAATLYHAMVLPYAGYAMRGVIWYQGESNAGRARQYHTLLPMMINDWRKAWNLPAGHRDFGFGIVELASFKAPKAQPGDDHWAQLREAQRMTAAKVPNAGTVSTLDLGNADDIHPRDKQSVGERLANWALATQYGQTDRVHQGPVITQSRFQDGKAVVTIQSRGQAPAIRWPSPIKGFALAGPDQQWRWASAKVIDGNTLAITSDEVPEPVAVRYAWESNPYDGPHGARITNDAGLPMSPYRSDDWPYLGENAR